MPFSKYILHTILLSTLLTSCALRPTTQPLQAEQTISLDVIHVSTAYADGGSYTISATTSNDQNLYIFIDNSQPFSNKVRDEVAFLNSIDLSNSPETLTAVLESMDSLFRQHFDRKPSHKLINFITSDDATEQDMKIFSLVFFMEDACAKRIFTRLNEQIVRNLNCSFYKPKNL